MFRSSPQSVPVDFLPNKHAISSLLSSDADVNFSISPCWRPSEELPSIDQLLRNSDSSSNVSSPELPESPCISDLGDNTAFPSVTTEHFSIPRSRPSAAGNTGGPIRRRKRADAQQLAVLNAVFAHTFFPSTDLRERLGRELGMSTRSVQIWFQNRRQQWRMKHKTSEDFGAHNEGLHVFWKPVVSQNSRIGLLPVPLGGVPLASRANDVAVLRMGPVHHVDTSAALNLPVICTVPFRPMSSY